MEPKFSCNYVNILLKHHTLKCLLRICRLQKSSTFFNQLCLHKHTQSLAHLWSSFHTFLSRTRGSAPTRPVAMPANLNWEFSHWLNFGVLLWSAHTCPEFTSINEINFITSTDPLFIEIAYKRNSDHATLYLLHFLYNSWLEDLDDKPINVYNVSVLSWQIENDKSCASCNTQPSFMSVQLASISCTACR